MKKTFLLAICLIIALSVARIALAQDDQTASAAPDSAVISDEITPQELGVAEPMVLPTNPIGYFFKNLGQAIKTTLTFNPVKKAELRLLQANKKLLEAKKLAEQRPDDPAVQALIQKSYEKYQSLMEKVQTRVEKLKEKSDQRAENLLNKIADQQFKQQQLMDTIQTKLQNLTTEQKAKLSEIKDKNLERFGQLLEKVSANQEELKNNLEKALTNTTKPLQNIKNLETIDRLETKLQNQDLKRVKEKVQNQVINNLKTDLEQALKSADKEKILKPLENMKLNSIEILQKVREQVKNPEAKSALEEAITKQLQNKTEQKQKTRMQNATSTVE